MINWYKHVYGIYIFEGHRVRIKKSLLHAFRFIISQEYIASQRQEKYHRTYAPNIDSDQPANLRSQ